MSRIYFHSPSGTAELMGSERAYMGVLISDLALGVLSPESYSRPEHLMQLVAQDHDLRKVMRSPHWTQWFRTSFSVGWSELFQYQGQPIETLALALNTALALGNDALKLLARLHGQCEIHAHIHPRNRMWVAKIIDQGVNSGLYRPEQGWKDVRAFLAASNVEPVVTSYSVTDGFPNATIADWQPPSDLSQNLAPTYYSDEEWAATDLETRAEYARDTWYELPVEERWETAMRGLTATRGGLEIKPDNWETFRFNHKLSAFDLVAADWEDRIRTALGVEA